MFEDLRNELNDENVPSDDEANTNETSDSGNVFDFTDDDRIDEALQETSSSDQFDRFGIYEGDIEEEEELEDEGEEKRILGMTAPQRFMMSVMIFFMVVILGAFCLILSGKIVLPFF